jgi:hypothetical protein
MAQVKGGGAGSSAAGGGSKSAAPNAGKIEKAFGAGADSIKTHGTDHADHGKLAAKAFTGGKTVHFGGAAADSAGDKLVAHEAAHVVQQKSGGAAVQR